jgi:hypothetical protein
MLHLWNKMPSSLIILIFTRKWSRTFAFLEMIWFILKFQALNTFCLGWRVLSCFSINDFFKIFLLYNLICNRMKFVFIFLICCGHFIHYLALIRSNCLSIKRWHPWVSWKVGIWKIKQGFRGTHTDLPGFREVFKNTSSYFINDLLFLMKRS